jgi:hypothetical protein
VTVDRALWLLMMLRFKGWLRRLGRGLRSPKGVLLGCLGVVVFLMVFSPYIIVSLVSKPRHDPVGLDGVRRIGPVVLLAYCLVSLIFSSDDLAIHFSPAEVNLLFPAPLSRRQLLGYKIASSLALTMLSGLFMTLMIGISAAWLVAAYVGLVLGLMFLQLFAIAMALVAANVGALAYSWRRKLALVLLGVLVVSGLWHAGAGLFDIPPWQLLLRAEKSPVVQAVLTPFRWFVLTYTAERLWPDLVQWSALAFLVDLGLVVFSIWLDAQYLESSAAYSARIYALIEQRRRGGGMPSPSKRLRFSLPSLPWWGGAGPIVWRQLTSAMRNPARLIMAPIVMTAMFAPMILTSSHLREEPEFLEAGTFLVVFYLTHLLPLGFRTDIDRMAELKALPVSPIQMAIGQLMTPVAYITLLQWVILAGIAIVSGGAGLLFWTVASLALPVNVILLEIQNAMFLWFPIRRTAVNADLFQTMGRGLLLMLASAACLAVAAVVAGLLAWVVDLVTNRNQAAIAVAIWLVFCGEAIGLMPLVALAYQQFDVARDVPP